MTRYLVDTSVLVDLSKWMEPTRSRLMEMAERGDELCVCAVVVTEFFAAVLSDEEMDWEEFFLSLRFLPTTSETAQAAGRYRRESRRIGRPIATPDALTASVARAWDAILLTENSKHFVMDGIQVRSLRS